jgi:hypothetical protein
MIKSDTRKKIKRRGKGEKRMEREQWRREEGKEGEEEEILKKSCNNIFLRGHRPQIY